MKKKFPFVAVGLILVGVLLLIDKMNVADLGWWTPLWAAVALYGGYKVAEAYRTKERGGIVWGTIFLCIGLYKTAEGFGLVDVPDGLLFPALLVVIGVGFLLALVRKPQEWHIAIPAIGLIGIGGAMILADLGIFERWEVLQLLGTWWPALLVLFGAALLLNRNSGRS